MADSSATNHATETAADGETPDDSAEAASLRAQLAQARSQIDDLEARVDKLRGDRDNWQRQADAAQRRLLEIDARQQRSAELMDTTVSGMERELILRTLRQTRANRTEAARRLGISVRTLRNKLNEYRARGIDVEGILEAAAR